MDDSKRESRRKLLKAGLVTGVAAPVFAATPVSFSRSPEPQSGVVKYDGAPSFDRGYTALDSAGKPRHTIGLSVSTPVPKSGSLDGGSWTSRIVVSDLEKDPSGSFSGGDIVEVIEGRDSISTFLMAADRARFVLSQSVEEQAGSIVWSQVPEALGYGLPSAIAVHPSTCQDPPASVVRKGPKRVENPRITHKSG